MKSSEAKFFEPPSADENNIKQFYDNLLDEKIFEETEKLQNIIGEKLRPEYENKLQQKLALLSNRKSSVKKPSRDEIEKIRGNFEVDSEIRMYTEKEEWKKEYMPSLIEEARYMVKVEHDQRVGKRTADLRNQAKAEIQDLFENLKKDSELAIKQKFREIDESESAREKETLERIRAECYDELRKDQDFRLRSALTDKLREQLEKEVRNELIRRIEMELRLRKEDEIREEVKISIEQEHEDIRKKFESEIRGKIQNLEEEFESNHNHLCVQEVDSKLERREKELKIDYMRKLEKLKDSSQKEFSDYQNQQSKKSKQLLSQEKSEVARLRSKLNVMLKKLTENRKSELQRLQSQEEVLDKKMREIQYFQQFKDEQPSRITCIKEERSRGSSKSPMASKQRSKSPFREQVSVISPKFPHPGIELIRSLPKPLPPPTLTNFKTIPQGTLSNYNNTSEKSTYQERSRSPERKLLGKYNSRELISDLIMKNLEDAKQQAWTLLKETEHPPLIKLSENDLDIRGFLSSRKTIHQNSIVKDYETDKSPRNAAPKHSKYQELLNQRHGVIEPRLK